MEFYKELNNIVKLLNTEMAVANNQGYSTVTLTNDEVSKIAAVLSQANHQIGTNNKR